MNGEGQMLPSELVLNSFSFDEFMAPQQSMAGTSKRRPYQTPSQRRSQNPGNSGKDDPKPWPSMFSLGLVTLLPPIYGLAVLFFRLGQPLPLLIYTILSIISFSIYGFDKYRATNSGWRIRENLLHTMDLLGGWPGGFGAQYFFRHKTRKVSFQIIFWASVLIHDYFWVRWCVWYWKV
jgi:uncharacterized membrane protein YsdA (DUF1294 family)